MLQYAPQEIKAVRLTEVRVPRSVCNTCALGPSPGEFLNSSPLCAVIDKGTEMSK